MHDRNDKEAQECYPHYIAWARRESRAFFESYSLPMALRQAAFVREESLFGIMTWRNT